MIICQLRLMHASLAAIISISAVFSSNFATNQKKESFIGFPTKVVVKSESCLINSLLVHFSALEMFFLQVFGLSSGQYCTGNNCH